MHEVDAILLEFKILSYKNTVCINTMYQDEKDLGEIKSSIAQSVIYLTGKM